MIEKVGIIYKVTNIVNNKIYIGQTIQVLKERKRQHYKFAKEKHNYKFSNALNKYNNDDFLWEILEDNIPIEYLNDKEVYYISLYNSFTKGYNSNPGKYNRFIRGCNDKSKNTILEFYNVDTNEILKISKCEFINTIANNFKEFSGAYRMINGNLLRYKKWILYKNYNKYIEWLNNIKLKSSNRFIDNTIYTILNTNSNEVFKGIRKDFIIKVGISKSCMHNLIKNHEIKTYKNWKIISIKKIEQ